MSDIPGFKDLDEAVAFWESHDSADYWDILEPVDLDVSLWQNLLGPRPIVLSRRPNQCPKCGEELDEAAMDFLVAGGNELRMVRDVPVLRCRRTHHLFMMEEVFAKMQRFLDGERVQEAPPIDTLMVPVYSLEA